MGGESRPMAVLGDWMRGRAVQSSVRQFLPIGLAAALPVILLSVIFGYHVSMQERRATELQAMLRADRVAQQLEGAMNAEIEATQPLANLHRLDSDDTSSFPEHVQRLQSTHTDWQTAFLSTPWGEPLIRVAKQVEYGTQEHMDQLDGFARAASQGVPVVGHLAAPGVISADRAIPLHIPVIRHGLVKYVVTIAILPRHIDEILAAADPPRDWEGAVLDQDGTVISRTGRQFPGNGRIGITERLPMAEFGHFRSDITSDGVPVYAYAQTIPFSRWSVHFDIPQALLDGPVRRARLGILAAAGVSLLLTLLLAYLVACYIAERRRAEMRSAQEALRVSETWRLLAVEAADIGTWHLDMKNGTIEWCDHCRTLAELPQGALPLSALLERIHPQDQAAVERAMAIGEGLLPPQEVEFRLSLAGGGVRWLRLSGHVASGHVADKDQTVYGIMINIDRQKKAMEEHRILLSRLNSAQEDERRRIARELHDRVGQSAAGLSLWLKRLEVGASTPATREAYAALHRMITEISRDIHRAAVELRPTALDDIGLEDALNAYLGEWSARSGVSVDIFMKGLDRHRLPSFIETTAYRIFVELFTNIERHAAAKAVSATVERRPNLLRIVVEDDGKGFVEPTAAPGQPQRHLGLLGIRERLELVNGHLEIESSLGAGTTVFVRIPLVAALSREVAA